MNINSPALDANLNAARRMTHHANVTVRSIRQCGGCGADATVLVSGTYPRCQPCANKIVNYWNEIKQSTQR